MNRLTFLRSPQKGIRPLRLSGPRFVRIPSAPSLPPKGTGGHGLPRTNKNPPPIARHSSPKGHGRVRPSKPPLRLRIYWGDPCKFDSCRAHQDAKSPIGNGRVFLFRSSYWLSLSFSVIAAAFFFCERTML